MRHSDASLDNCLKCSVCNSVCPVMTAHPAYPGPKHLGPELERFRREGLPCDNDGLEDCLGCERCDMACPNQVNVAELILAAKGRHKKPPPRRLRDALLARPALLGRLFSLWPALSNRLLGWPLMKRLMALTAGITARRSFPAYARPRLDRRPTPPAGDKRVTFFLGCSMRYNEPGLGEDCFALLDRNGFSVAVSPASCCGYPALANGQPAEARRRALANLELLWPAAARGEAIVTACTTCGQLLKTGFSAQLGDDAALAEKARTVEAAVYDLGEFLMDLAERDQLDRAFRPLPHGPLAYHAPCHQTAQGLSRPWYHLLRQLPGLEVADLDAGCCGMAGTFGFKQEKYDLSMAVGARLFQAIEGAAPEAVLSECPTCRMQITQGSGRPARHPASLLREAYGQTPTATP